MFIIPYSFPLQRWARQKSTTHKKNIYKGEEHIRSNCLILEEMWDDITHTFVLKINWKNYFSKALTLLSKAQRIS